MCHVRLKKRAKKDESGLIQGAGTGTSDSIKKDVPAGSYIMPADSTKQIGARNLKNLGKPKNTEVNVSKGEYLLPPEQLQAIGGEVLQNMKQQTHTPVEKQGFGFNPKMMGKSQVPQGEPAKLGMNSAALSLYQDNIKIGESGKPELFFASGTDEKGVPDKDTFLGLSKSSWTGNALGQPKSPTAALQNNSTQKPTTQSQTEKLEAPSFTESVVDDMGRNVGNEWSQGNYARALGQGARGILTLPAAAAYDGVVKPVGGFLGGLLNTGNSGNSAPPASQPVAKAITNTKAINSATEATKLNSATTTDTATEQKVEQPTPSAFDLGQQQSVGQSNTNPYAITQKGNSFSYSDANAAAEARAAGIPEMQGFGMRIKSFGDPTGVKNLLANTREMGANEQQIQDALARREMNIDMQGYGGIARQPQVPERTPAQEAERQAVIRAASTPIAGARGLTANQVRTLSDLQQGEDNRANQRYTTDANNVAALQREAMGQAGQNYRTELGEQGTNNRFNANLGFDAQKFQATNDLANREFNLNATEKGFGIRNSARLEKLYEQYDSAKSDEERQSLQEKINRYTGGGKSNNDNKLISFKQHELMDEEGNITQPAKDMFYNPTTGQTIDPLAQKVGSNNQRAIGTVSKVGDKTAVWNGSQWVQNLL